MCTQAKDVVISIHACTINLTGGKVFIFARPTYIYE